MRTLGPRDAARQPNPTPHSPPLPCQANQTQLIAAATSRQAVILVYFLYLMDFDFDPAKSAANLKKHGIDFVDAQALWNDPDRLEIPPVPSTSLEPR